MQLAVVDGARISCYFFLLNASHGEGCNPLHLAQTYACEQCAGRGQNGSAAGMKNGGPR